MTTFAMGIDPSLTGTAIADLDIKTLTTGESDERLDLIHRFVRDAVRFFHWFAVVEDLPTHAHGAGKTGMAHGVVRLALIQADVPYITIPPATLKKFATGNGGASKADMRMAWFKRTKEDVRDDNQVDALWLREIGRYALGSPDALTMPKAQRECLFKLAWPEDITARMLEPYEQVEVG